MATSSVFVYPYFQLSPVLEACTDFLTPHVALVIFYPGEVDAKMAWHMGRVTRCTGGRNGL